MFQHTQPAAFDDPGHESWAPFRVDSASEIAGLMRQLRDTGTPLVLSDPAGTALVTELWSLDLERQRINFVADDNNPLLQQFVDSDEAVAVGYLDNVKLQFDLHDLLLVRGTGTCALQAQLPLVLYRFQRRSAYRVRTLERHSPTARLRHPAIPDMRLALRVLDVSIGGCALFLPADVPPLTPGVLLNGVLLELTPETKLQTNLRLQHVSVINQDAKGSKLGCEMVNPARDSQRDLQAFIDQTQKRRRLMVLS